MVERNESIIRSTRMAVAITLGGNRNMWREGRQMKGKCNRMPKVIDGISWDKEISELLAKKFGTLYNSVGYDTDCIKIVENGVHNMIEDNINHNVIEGLININNLDNAIKQIKCNKHETCLYFDHIINGTDNRNIVRLIIVKSKTIFTVKHVSHVYYMWWFRCITHVIHTPVIHV